MRLVKFGIKGASVAGDDDIAEGLPEDDIPPGTRFEDLPEDWECPDCGISKADFEPMAA